MKRLLSLLFLLLALAPIAVFGQVVSQQNPQTTYQDLSQSISGGGYWRFYWNNGTFSLQQNTSANPPYFASSVTPISIAANTGVITFSSAPAFSSLTANSFLYSGIGGGLTSSAAPTNGQILIGSTGVAPVVGSLTGTANQTTITNGAGTITLSLTGPFGFTTQTLNGVLYGNGSSTILATAQGGSNTVLTANGGAPSFSSSPTIGTSLTTPLAILNTAGSNGTLQFSGANTIRSLAAGTILRINPIASGQPIQINNFADTQNNMVIADAGPVGIGGTPTAGLLDVFGAGTISANFRSTNASGGYINIFDSTNSTNRGQVGYGSAVFVGGSISDFGITSGSAGALKLASAGGTVGITIDTSQNSKFAGNVSIGSSNVSYPLLIHATTNVNMEMGNSGGTFADKVANDSDNAYAPYSLGAATITLATGGATAVTIDGSQNATFAGNILLSATDNTKNLFSALARGASGYFGTSLNVGLATNAAGMIYAGSNSLSTIVTDTAVASTVGSLWQMRKARGTQAALVDVQSGDVLGQLAFYGYSGATGYWQTSLVQSLVDGAVVDNQKPGSQVQIETTPPNGSTVVNFTVRGNGAYYGTVDAIGTVGSSTSLDVTKGNVHTLTSTASTNMTITPSAAGTAGECLVIIITSDATGGDVVTFASTFKPNGTMTLTASKKHSITFCSDGTNLVETGRVTGL